MNQYQGMMPVVPPGNSFMQPQYPSNVCVPLPPQMQEKLWEAQLQLSLQVEKGQYDLLQAREMSRIRCEEAEYKAKTAANVKERRAFQQTTIAIGSKGQLILEKNMFGEKIHGELPFKLLNPQRFVCIKEEVCVDEVLLVTSINTSEKRGTLIFKANELKKSHLARQFEKEGLTCGFGEKKEAEVRRLIVQDLWNRALQREIPERHGWKKDRQGIWRYIDPEMLTWEEVKKWK